MGSVSNTGGITGPETGGAAVGTASLKSGSRLIELDILRGFLLLWMTLTHLPTKANIISNQTFGFVSGAEGFIFLAGFMVGQLESRKESRAGAAATVRDIGRRTWRIYVYHSALVALAFTVFAKFSVAYHRMAIQNLLSYYLQDSKHAVIAAALLLYRPSLMDILPMYIVFMALTPVARRIAHRWGWDPLVYASFGIWAAAQFGLRAWLYRQGRLFGLDVPETSTGAFDLYAWQLLWLVALALGTIYAERLREANDAHAADDDSGLQPWLVRLSLVVAGCFLVLRYSPIDRLMDPNVYGWLIDKWHLGPARVINFTAITVVLVRFGTRIASPRFLRPLAAMGQASLEVFSVHVFCCLCGVALSHDADPNLPLWQQALLLVFTLSALFATAYFVRWKRARGRSAAQAGLALAVN
ncbi:MAG: OpgC domain-containing protein [Acidobacteriaceae bacterium]|nr:OpgC domain-containing protein [Acidobacteriaceae bacterium]